MAWIAFTTHLKRVTDTPEFDTGAATLLAALEHAFTLPCRVTPQGA
jgi:hypothetical protein